jgi:putative transposase
VRKTEKLNSRDECPNQHWFLSIADAQRTIARWRVAFNTARPHRSLAGRTPTQVAEALTLLTNTTRLSA